MGIQYLNRFLKGECKDSIQILSLKEFSGKKIAVDISIYIYKYAADNNLIENMYLMLSVFRAYHIIPVFIFDGKPPTEKKELLIKRIKDKKTAEDEYNKIKEELEAKKELLDEVEKQEMLSNMDVLKKQFISINKNQIEDVKNLIRAYGASYYDAPGEADELCAKLVLKGKVWGCLSEDMDMFVYGVNRVIRYLSLLNHTAVLYDMEGILKKLGITQKELREICVLSGTDYNMKKENDKNTPTLYKTLKYFKRYHNENTDNGVDFYHWLIENTDYIQDCSLLRKIYSMFDLLNIEENDDKLKTFNRISLDNGPIIQSNIREILKKDGFLFPVCKD
jgi:flap endonuclease-1